MTNSNDAVVVTGIGATTPLGGTAQSSWQQLLAGESGISQLTADWAPKTCPCESRESRRSTPRPNLIESRLDVGIDRNSSP